MAAQKVSYKHALAVWKAMDSSRDEDGLWRGQTTYLLLSLDIPPSYYTGLFTRGLVRCGTLGQLERGAPRTPSVWEVAPNPPTEAEWKEILEIPLTGENRSATVRAELEAITNNLGGYNVGEEIAWLKNRVQLLEEQVRKLGKTNNRKR